MMAVLVVITVMGMVMIWLKYRSTFHFECNVYHLAQKGLPCAFNCGFVCDTVDLRASIVFIFCPDFFPPVLFSMTS